MYIDYIYIYIYIYIYLYIYIYVCVCVYIYVYTYFCTIIRSRSLLEYYLVYALQFTYTNLQISWAMSNE